MQLSVAIEALGFDHGYANWLQMPNASSWKSVHLPKFHAEFIRNVARIFNFALLFPTWVKLSLCLSNELLSGVQGASLSVLIRAADRWCSLGTASKEKPWPWGLQLCLIRSEFSPLCLLPSQPHLYSYSSPGNFPLLLAHCTCSTLLLCLKFSQAGVFLFQVSRLGHSRSWGSLWDIPTGVPGAVQDGQAQEKLGKQMREYSSYTPASWLRFNV